MAQRRSHQAGPSALAAPHDDLLRRCHTAERLGDWQEGAILNALVDVADYVKRIGDNPESSHYRAEKAGALLVAAIRLHRDALLSYGGWPEDDATERAVLTGSRLLEDVAEHVGQTMWQAIRVARDDTAALNRSETDDFVHVGDSANAGRHGRTANEARRTSASEQPVQASTRVQRVVKKLAKGAV
jgi:hypothetical protein